MVSGESGSPSMPEKSFSCYVHRAKMAASGVRRGNQQRNARLKEEGRDEGRRKTRKKDEEKDHEAVK